MEYSKLSSGEKASFIDENTPIVHRSPIESYFGGLQFPIRLFVDKGTIDVIISDVRFSE